MGKAKQAELAMQCNTSKQSKANSGQLSKQSYASIAKQAKQARQHKSKQTQWHTLQIWQADHDGMRLGILIPSESILFAGCERHTFEKKISRCSLGERSDRC